VKLTAIDTLRRGYPLGWNDLVGRGESILAAELVGVKVNSVAQTQTEMVGKEGNRVREWEWDSSL
jgi:hypothetical protein